MTTLNLESALKLAQEAKELRCKAQLVEKKAVKSFRCARTKYVKALQKEEARLEEEKKNLQTEYLALAHAFCEQNRGHILVTGYNKRMRKYTKCIICSEPSFLAYTSGSDNSYLKTIENVVQGAAEQTENLELRKTAERMFEIREQYKNITDKLHEICKGLREVCSIFGHDAKRAYNDYAEEFYCKCCGSRIGCREYVADHYAAKYKGGIVPYLYEDDSTIL